LKLIENRSIGAAVCGTIGALLPPPPAAIAPALRDANNGLSKYANGAVQYFMADQGLINARSGRAIRFRSLSCRRALLGTQTPLPPSPRLAIKGSRDLDVRALRYHVAARRAIYLISFARFAARTIRCQVARLDDSRDASRTVGSRRATESEVSKSKRDIRSRSRWQPELHDGIPEFLPPSADPFSRFHSSTIRAGSLNGRDA